jgi:hypothetical protein
MRGETGRHSTGCGGSPEVTGIGKNNSVAMDVGKAKKFGLGGSGASNEYRGDKPKEANPRF